jgi:hypothetical protein
VDLIRDVLDSQVVDRNGREMGRVDGIVGEYRAGDPLRIVAIEVGPSVLGHRLHPAIGRLIEGIEHMLGVDKGRPVRIPVSRILDTAHNVKVDFAIGETAALSVDHKLRAWISRIPGSE